MEQSSLGDNVYVVRAADAASALPRDLLNRAVELIGRRCSPPTERACNTLVPLVHKIVFGVYARTKQDFALSYGARKPVTRPLDAEAVQQLNSEMLVSIKGGEVVGACLLTKSDEYVVAQLLAVVEQFEKTGIGSGLLDAACSIARDHTTTGSSRLRAGCLLVPATSKWWAGSSKAHWLRPMDLTSGSFAAEAAAKQLQHLPLLFRLGENDPILRWQCDEPRVGWLEAEETPQPPLRLEAPAAAKPGPVLAPIAESSGYKLFLNSQAASGYTGVSKLSNGSYHAQYRPLAATKAFAGKTVFLGMHETAVGAAVAYARYCESQGIYAENAPQPAQSRYPIVPFVPTAAAASSSGRMDEGYDEEEEEEEEAWVGCFCGTERHLATNTLSFEGVWVQCDTCDRWVHGECAGVDKETAEQLESYRCPACGGDDEEMVEGPIVQGYRLSLSRNSSTGFLGVYKLGHFGKFTAMRSWKGRHIRIGTYDTAIEAAVAYGIRKRMW